MQIITHLAYDNDRHTVIDFLKKNFKTSMFPLYSPKKVSESISNVNSTDAILNIITAAWSPMMMVPGNLTSQRVDVKLAGGAWMHVYLLSTGKFRDRTVLMMHGKGKETLYMYMGYVGDTDVYNRMVKEMNITELEAHLGANHYLSDEEE